MPRVPVTPTGVVLVGSVVLMGVRHAAAAAAAVVVLPRLAMHMDAESVRIHMAQVLMGCVVLTGALDAFKG